jgi:hypothetical protein
LSRHNLHDLNARAMPWGLVSSNQGLEHSPSRKT